MLWEPGLNLYSSLSLASKAEIDLIMQDASRIAEDIVQMQIHNRRKRQIYSYVCERCSSSLDEDYQ